jgi:hypothetical protein
MCSAVVAIIMLLRDLGFSGVLFMTVSCNRCHGNAVKGFRALCGISVTVVTNLDSPLFFTADLLVFV